MTSRPGSDLVEAVRAAAGHEPTSWERVTGGGYTPAERWIVTFEDATRSFAKFGSTELVAEWLRLEHRAYVDIDGPFMPGFTGWADGTRPVLLLEDLSAARWPPPWQPGDVDRVLETLGLVSATPCPAWATPVEFLEFFDGWSRIAADPDPFLGLGLVGTAWLDGSLGALLAAEAPGELHGDELLHLDVRSDNLCFRDDLALLVDWNPPHPPHRRGYCSRAAMPPIPDAPRVRDVQLEQARTALPWAARWLGLPAPDGPAVTTSA